ncbi:hypothetical protein J4207_01655 [Candidatus Woesearchaeota archaeon]|nr:hypothetical protein [Candidatus Woesearchaeota archaeon]
MAEHIQKTRFDVAAKCLGYEIMGDDNSGIYTHGVEMNANAFTAIGTPAVEVELTSSRCPQTKYILHIDGFREENGRIVHFDFRGIGKKVAAKRPAEELLRIFDDVDEAKEPSRLEDYTPEGQQAIDVLAAKMIGTPSTTDVAFTKEGMRDYLQEIGRVIAPLEKLLIPEAIHHVSSWVRNR